MKHSLELVNIYVSSNVWINLAWVSVEHGHFNPGNESVVIACYVSACISRSESWLQTHVRSKTHRDKMNSKDIY